MARVPYLTPGEISPDDLDRFDDGGWPAVDLNSNIDGAVVHNPAVLEAWSTWVSALWDAVEDPRHRELAILAVASETGSRYQWHHHVAIAQDAGVSRSEIVKISDTAFETFTKREQSLLQYSTAAARGSVDDATHDALATQFDHQSIISLVFLITEYIRIACVIDALQIEVEGEFVGWQLERSE